MQVVILDEFRQRGAQIAEGLGSGCKVSNCQLSNDFLTQLNGAAPDKVIIDLPTWNSGRALYNYFEVSRKLETIPVVVYNAPENFETLPGRPRHNRDKVLPKPADVASVVEATLNQE